MLTDITLGQYFPGTSFLHKLDPRIKIVATMIFIIAIFFAHSLASYALVTAFVALSFSISRLPVKFILKSLKPLWVIIIFTMGVHIFTTPGDVLWQYGIFHITKEGLYQGALMTARLVFLIVFSSLLTYTTSPIVLTDGIEHLLNPFKRIGVPAHELAMMMTISSIFLLIDGSPEALEKKKALWEYLRSVDPALYRKLKYRSMSVVSNFPGYQGRKLSVQLYRLARRVYKFN